MLFTRWIRKESAYYVGCRGHPADPMLVRGGELLTYGRRIHPKGCAAPTSTDGVVITALHYVQGSAMALDGNRVGKRICCEAIHYRERRTSVYE